MTGRTRTDRPERRPDQSMGALTAKDTESPTEPSPLSDVVSHLAIVDENLAKVAAAAQQAHAEAERLMPWLLEGLTWDEAVAAWHAANPDDDRSEVGL